ncbi:MAG TPA: DUF4397 domain-containing protein [Gillisia sp.]|nr:DUF4397 domain-containing protein [Gillisia sp.]
MKNILNRIVLIIAAGLFFTGCEENAIPELAQPITGEMTKAKFFFHADDAPPANFYFGENKVTAAGSTTAGDPQGSAYRAVYPSNAYAIVPSGNHNVRALDLEMNELAATQATFSAGSNYSVYLVGSGDHEVLVMEDNLPADDNVKIYWRFVHTMADVPFTVDVYAVRAAVAATDTEPAQPARAIALGSDLDFKEGGEYVELEPGNYTFKVFDSNADYDPLTSTPFIQHTVNVGTLGRSYTTQIRGTYSAPIGTGKIDFWRDR